jgi:hypothetical protein
MLFDIIIGLVITGVFALIGGPFITRTLNARGWESATKKDGRLIWFISAYIDDLLWDVLLRDLLFRGRELGVRATDWIPFFVISTLILYVSLVISSKIVLKQPFSKMFKVWIPWAIGLAVIDIIFGIVMVYVSKSAGL